MEEEERKVRADSDCLFNDVECSWDERTRVARTVNSSFFFSLSLSLSFFLFFSDRFWLVNVWCSRTKTREVRAQDQRKKRLCTLIQICLHFEAHSSSQLATKAPKCSKSN